MNTQTEKLTKRNIAIFTLAVLGLAILAWIVEPFTVPPDAEPCTAGLGQLLWIVSPVLVMVLLRSFGGDGWSDFGMRPNFKGNGFWWWTSILYYPLIVLVILLLGTLTGGLALNLDALNGAVPILITLLFSSLVKNIFEEFAWRGYLAPRVYSLKKNIWLSHAFVGLVWGLWHLPFVVAFWPYLTPDMLPIFIPLLLLGTMCDSVVYGEIRLATNSVLPAWVSHTVGNVVGNFLILNSVITFRSGQELLFTPGGEGVISMVLMLALGIWLHTQRIKPK
jgi:membrane protease YdiL (CAAX protease family)